jgi:hypothetical protein
LAHSALDAYANRRRKRDYENTKLSNYVLRFEEMSNG